MAISSVGTAHTSAGPGVVTVNVSPTATGNILVFEFFANTGTAAVVSGGGVTTWNKAVDSNESAGNLYSGIWWGLVTSTGASVITVSGTFTGFNELWAREFTSDLTVWSQVAATFNTSSGINVSYPSLTCSGATEYMYVGAGWSIFGNMNVGSTPGFTYEQAGGSEQQAAWALNVTGAVQPTTTQTNTGAYQVSAVILGVSSATTPAPFFQPNKGITGTPGHKGGVAGGTGAPYKTVPSPFIAPHTAIAGTRSARKGNSQAANGLKFVHIQTFPPPFIAPKTAVRGTMKALRGKSYGGIGKFTKAAGGGPVTFVLGMMSLNWTTGPVGADWSTGQPGTNWVAGPMHT